MIIYAVGGSEEEVAKLQHFCEGMGWDFRLTRRLGRPPANHPIQNVLDAYDRVLSIRGAAMSAGVSPGTAHRILRGAGKIGDKGDQWRNLNSRTATPE